MERAPPPPPAAPPPPPLPGTPGSPPGLGRVLREALERAGEALGEDGGLRELLKRRRDSFQGPLKWLLFHRPVPPLIQDGPQCGLVALAMAGALLGPPRPQLGLGALLETARARGYTRHGEMFSAAQLAALAQELLPCRAELLQGGLRGPNLGRILRHLQRGHPLLVPYDEDSNHGPCCRRGHKAHWALLNGLLLAVPPRAPLGPQFLQDPEIPNVFHARGGALLGEGALAWPVIPPGPGVPPGGPGEGSRAQGMWDLGRGSWLEKRSQAEDMPGFGEGSGFGVGSGFEEGFQAEGTLGFELGLGFEEGSGFGEGSRAEGIPGFGEGSGCGWGSGFGDGSGFEEGSEAEGFPGVGSGSGFGSGSGSGSGFGSGVLVLALQGKSPRPQLWPLGALGASNAQLSELSPRRWGGGFVLPPGGLRGGLRGRAVLLHPLETPPQ